MAEQQTEPDSGGSSPVSEPSAAPRGAARDIFEGGAVGASIAAIAVALFVWWAWKDGAYFGVVFFPGAMLVFATLILLAIGAPLNLRLDGPARVALLAISGLAVWTLLSVLWTDSHNGALQDAERALLYAAIFGLGLWACRLSDRRHLAPLGAVAVAGALVGVVITVTLAGGTNVSEIFQDATLRFPIGYRNAEAAFLLVCLWPTLALAAEGELRWELRALLVGSATMLLELVVLAQSRGSLPAAVVAMAVFFVLSGHRLRAAVYLALAAVPILPAMPTLLDVFQHGQDPQLVPLMRDAARVIVLTSLGSVVLAAVCLRGLGPRVNLGRRRELLISRVLAVLAIGVVAVGSTVFFVKRGGPINFVDQRVSEFTALGYPDLSKHATRFGTNVGSNRHDFWRVAWDEFGDHPIAGGGAGSWQFAYLEHRKSGESPKDPHSGEFLFLSELGIVGLLLIATFAVAVTLAGLRTRRMGPSGAMLATGALASGAYMLVHASYDWFWHYPALIAPVMFLLGACAAPALAEGVWRFGQWSRWAVAAAVGLALLLAVPLFLSQRYANRAYDEYSSDPGAALSDLDRAADLNPYDPQPLYAKGVIEGREKRDVPAAASFREAIDREWVNYAGHYFLATVLERSDPAGARSEVSEAMRLNPFDLKSRALARRLGLKPKKIQVG
jgi:hypothetical protein